MEISSTPKPSQSDVQVQRKAQRTEEARTEAKKDGAEEAARQSADADKSRAIDTKA